MSLGSRNPFRTRLTSPAEPKPPTPGSPPGSPPPATTPPRAAEEPSSMNDTPSRPPNGAPPSSNTRQTDLEALSAEPMEEPPPYTPAPSAQEGELSLEYGPNRPFQPPPPRPAPPPAPRLNAPPSSPPWVAPNNTGLSSSPSLPSSSSRPSMGSLMHQLTSSITNAVNTLNGPRTGSGFITPHTTGHSSSSWSSYPGGPLAGQRPYQPPASARPTPGSSTRLAPPPRHPFSQSTPDVSSTSRNQTSDFARDFYAAGTGEDVGVRPNNTSHSPPLPSRPDRRSFGSTPTAATNDGRPTTQPSLGHPLLKDGKLLVYPRGYICDKCHNVGYKNQDPLRPCKKCWGKYAKTFSGPLVYSFSPDSPAENFQRPLTRLPPPAPPPIPPAVSLNPPPAHFAPGGYMNNHHGGFFSPPIPNPGFSRPPPGAIVYSAGDPRIGGRLCWRCDGKGNVSLLFLDRMTCDVCGGIGRTFN